MPAQHFTPKLFAFLRELAANNERDVRTPALQFINDFAAPLAKFAKSCKTMAPLVRFVAHSLDLPW